MEAVSELPERLMPMMITCDALRRAALQAIDLQRVTQTSVQFTPYSSLHAEPSTNSTHSRLTAQRIHTIPNRLSPLQPLQLGSSLPDKEWTSEGAVNGGVPTTTAAAGSKESVLMTQLHTAPTP